MDYPYKVVYTKCLRMFQNKACWDDIENSLSQIHIEAHSTCYINKNEDPSKHQKIYHPNKQNAIRTSHWKHLAYSKNWKPITSVPYIASYDTSRLFDASGKNIPLQNGFNFFYSVTGTFVPLPYAVGLYHNSAEENAENSMSLFCVI